MRKRALNVIILLVATLVSGYFLVCPADQAAIVARAQSGPDLTVQAITSSPATPAIGDETTFTVTLKNQGTTSSGYNYVAYYIDDVYLTNDYVAPIGPGASVEYTFTWTAEAGAHTVKAVADYRQQVNESNEGNNTKTYTFATLSPDLIIDSISWSPAEPSVSSTVTFTVTIKNLGALVANPSRVHFYIDGISRGYKDISRIYAGETLTATFSWFAKAGTHDIKAIIDKTDAVPEMDENNNEKTVLFSPLLPDLIIDDITWDPAQPSIGDNVSFTVTVANQGSGVAGNSTVHFYVNENHLASELTSELAPSAAENLTFSWVLGYAPRSITALVAAGDMVIESDDTNNEKTYILSPMLSDLTIQEITWFPDSPEIGENVTFTVPVLNQGSGNSITSRVNFLVDNDIVDYQWLAPVVAGEAETLYFNWLAKGGVHKIQAVVDPQRKVPESDETNNTRTITFPALPPDLIIEQITWMPPEPAIGDTVTFTVTVRNQGEASSGYAYMVYYVDNIQIATGRVNPISYNATDNQTFAWTLTPGEHIVKAFVDITDIVDESDETNNEGSTTLAPFGPDLIIESIGWSRNNPQAGEMVTFSATVKNNGSVLSSASIVHLYVDDSSRGYQNIPKLSPGANATATFNWKFMPGLHDIQAVTDDTNLVVEINEQNNEMLISYPIPDLTFDALTWSPAEPAIGEKVTLTAYAQNIGSLRAEAFQLYFYIDDDVAEQREIPSLDAGALVTEIFEWEATFGPHVLTVMTDGANAISEGAENNNERMANFSISAPDLIIESISWPTGIPPTGENVTFMVTIRNQGDAEANYAYVSYYVDGEYLTSEQTRALKPGTKTEKLFSTLMSQTGLHVIKVVIDEGNKVLESDETNNDKTLPISTESITQPAQEDEKPVLQPLTPSQVPQTTTKKDNTVIIFFGIVVLFFTAALILSVYREFRKRNE